MKTRLAMAAVLLTMTTSGGAAAQTLVSAEDPAAVAAIVQKLGFQAQLDEDSVGDPMIRSSSSGVGFTIFFYGCTDNERCRSLQFLVGYDLANGTTLEVVESWNEDKRFASAYLDDESDPFLQMDVNTEGGISVENFEKTFLLWQSLKGEFEQRIDFHAEPNEKPEVRTSTSRA